VTTSSSDNFSVNRNDIINTANEIAGVKGIGRVLSSEDIDRSSLLLNLIVKQWMGKSDFAPGLKVWTRKRAYLFPQLNQSDYVLGATDHATASYVSTTMRIAGVALDTTLEVTSTTGMTAGDNIGIIMDSGTVHWDTVASVTDSDTVVITTGLAAAAAVGNTIYAYTTRISNPLQMLSVRRMDTSNNETPLGVMTFAEYEEGLLKKNNSGDPAFYIYERGLTTGTLRFDYQVQDTSEIILLTYLRPVEDFDAATDTPDYPQEWFKPLVGQLAMDVATATGKPVTQDMKLYRDEALAIAQNVDPDNEVVFYEPDT